MGTGESSTQVTPFQPGGVSDGNWHTVHIHYYNKVGLGIILSVFSAIYMYSLISPFEPCFDAIKPTTLLKITLLLFNRTGLHFKVR